MYLRPNPRYLIHGTLVVGFHLGQVDDRLGESKDAVKPVRPAEPAQPEFWEVPSLHVERLDRDQRTGYNREAGYRRGILGGVRARD